MRSELVVAHFHLRPGGVRSVIETALPAVTAGGRFGAVTLATGEAAEEAWLDRLRGALDGVPLRVFVDPALHYRDRRSEGPGRQALTRVCADLLARAGGADAVLWAHNLAIGRNAVLAAAWGKAAAETGAVFLSHHHDWFFDNRWGRWPEMCHAGLDRLETVAEVLFPSGPRTVHLAINRADHALLAEGFGERAVYVPDPVRTARGTGSGEVARAWLAGRAGGGGPCWLLPCRLLRRKNIAEAVLLARWLQPGARVVTTGGVTSHDEETYAARLGDEARRGGWPLDLAVLRGAGPQPRVEDLMLAAQTVVFTSLQEGFGLPLVEAAAAGRPLLARRLPRVMADMESMGLRAPVLYDDVLVPTDFFDVREERRRVKRLWEDWKAALPEEASGCVTGMPRVLAAGPAEPVGFSGLTLSGQADVLRRSGDELHAGLAALNPGLAAWRGRVGQMPSAEIDPGRCASLSAGAFAAVFGAATDRAVAAPNPPPGAGGRVMHAFLADRLRGDEMFPLLLARGE